jgi:uncharacterized protein YlbG (UPF0298 family)
MKDNQSVESVSFNELLDFCNLVESRCSGGDLLEDVRPIKELYIILYENIKNLNRIASICNMIYAIAYLHKINISECAYLLKHFQFERYKHPEFMTEELNWNRGNYNRTWWNSFENENPVNRKAFIQKIISTL